MPLIKTQDYETKPIDKTEKIFKEYIERENITLSVRETDRAFYCLADDSITLPLISQFKNAEEYYSTAFHECGHSTLKEHRCNRVADQTTAFFGNEDYSKEELVAEITSASILNSIGIETQDSFQNSVSYIQNWLRVLKNDKRCIVSATGKAEKAAKYILGIS
jgi:antirestriction protein ArdC